LPTLLYSTLGSKNISTISIEEKGISASLKRGSSSPYALEVRPLQANFRGSLVSASERVGKGRCTSRF
jgi:hypothetical protein